MKTRSLVAQTAMARARSEQLMITGHGRLETQTV
jgi:hypothetical protein